MTVTAEPRRYVRGKVDKSLWNVLGTLVGLVMIFPVYWMVSRSFKTGVNLQRTVPQWRPHPFTLDSTIGPSLAYLSFVLPFTVWTLRRFIVAAPIDLEKAALVDAWTRGQAFRKIILPLAVPGLVATSVSAVIQAWNEYPFAYVLLKQYGKQAIAVWLDTFITIKGVDGGALTAASTIVALLIVVLFAFIQRKVAVGNAAGVVKG